MAAVDQHQQLHACGASAFEQSVERRADRTTGVEHVVHQNDVFAGDVIRDGGRIGDRALPDRREVVAVEIDVEFADGDLAAFQILDLFRQALGERHSAAADANEGESIEILGAFENFVGEADESAVDFRRAHQLGFFFSGGHDRTR